jgi:hypothetical protein
LSQNSTHRIFFNRPIPILVWCARRTPQAVAASNRRNHGRTHARNKIEFNGVGGLRTHISLRASQSVFPEEQGDDRGSHGTIYLFQHQHFPCSRSRRGSCAERDLVYEHACRSGLSSRADRDQPWRMFGDSILGDRAISRTPATTKPPCRAATTEALSLKLSHSTLPDAPRRKAQSSYSDLTPSKHNAARAEYVRSAALRIFSWALKSPARI